MAKCTDPVIGKILAGWRYDISGIAPEMRGDYEAHFRDHVWKAGRFHDVYGLAILAADWSRVRDEVEARLRAKGNDPDTLMIRSA